MAQSELAATVAHWLPEDVQLQIRHLTHAQTECDPIFSSPPGEQPEPTCFQSHFFLVSIQHYKKETTEVAADGHRELLVFAIEVIVYSTAQLTTVFVSKADSTGYLYLVNSLAPVIRNVSTALLSHLARVHQRPGVRLVLCLFARAQNQYLFPGSSENTRKHILDDRGLIKWWCRAFDPILRTFEPEVRRGQAEHKDPGETEKASATAYLIVPGCDRWETKAFFPATSASDDNERRPRWVNSYPLNQISAFPTAPPRCLVPRFPDDPKARFLLDLDEEVPDGSQSGQWRSVQTLDQFWELMAFRQECSAGRLVGFLWLVVNPPGVLNSQGITAQPAPALESPKAAPSALTTPQGPPFETDTAGASSTPLRTESGETFEKPDANAASTIETESKQRAALGVDGRTFFLSHQDYNAITEFLAQLDFADEKLALESTTSVFEKLSAVSGQTIHGETITGQWKRPVEPPAAPSPQTSPSKMNVLGSGFIRKRKRADPIQGPSAGSGNYGPNVNGSGEGSTDGKVEPVNPTFNVLQTRKKNKPAG